MNMEDIFTRCPGEEDAARGQPGGRGVLPPVTALAAAVLLIAVLGALVWCFTGTVTTTVDISGIVFPQHGIEQLRCRQDGLVSYLQVEVGDMVQAGDLIAIIPQLDVYAAIEQAHAAGAPQEELDALYEQYQAQSMIYTPVSGRVVDLVQKGQSVQAGEQIAGITSSDVYSNDVEIRAYVPVAVAQSISKGMTVRAYPQFTSGEQYQYIQGLVSDISTYPISLTDISEDLGRFYSSESIPQEGNIIEVRVTLLAGAEGESLSWTRADGGSLAVDFSTLCSMEVVVSETTPWERLTSWMGRGRQ